ncbi:partner of Y14 and mago-like [Branchiostoma floridae x Branchiostoma japonicum]
MLQKNMAEAVTDDVTGEKFIPASQRPDGTWRKARRVKQGYVPQEEVPVYESKGTQWMKSKPTLPPGFYPDPEEQVKQMSEEDKYAGMSKAAKKNAKRKEKKKQQQGDGGAGPITQGLEQVNISNQSQETKINNGQSQDSTSEPAKKLKGLKKKLRQIEDLEAKIESGELAKPDKTQLDKIKRKTEILKEIRELEKQVGS